MEFDDLKHTWHKQETNKALDYGPEELLMLLNNKLVSFEEQIKSRDRREIIAAVFVILAFAILFFVMQSIWQKTGSAIIVLSGLYIVYKLKTAQRKSIDEKPGFDRTLYDHLLHELRWVKKQQSLLRRIVWWYVAPITLGLVIFAIGFEWMIFKLIYIGVVVLIGIIIWKLNRRAVKKIHDPLIEELREAISVLERSE